MVVDNRTPDHGEENALALAYVQLQQQFVAGLVKRQSEIIQARDHSERLAALHRLAGAAGSFGFQELSVLAKQAMHAASHDYQKDNKAKNAQQCEKVLTQLLKKIQLEINRISPASPVNSVTKASEDFKK